MEEKALGYDKNGYYDKQSSLLCIFCPLPARAFSSFILHLFCVEKDNYCFFSLPYLIDLFPLKLFFLVLFAFSRTGLGCSAGSFFRGCSCLLLSVSSLVLSV